MCRPIAVLAALAVGLLVLSDCPSTEGAGRRGSRGGRCCYTPCPPNCETSPFYHVAPSGYALRQVSKDLVHIYCCCNGMWDHRASVPLEKAEEEMKKCTDEDCTSPFYSTDFMDIENTVCVSPIRRTAAPGAPQRWYVYCCCHGCWKALGPYDNHGTAHSAAQHCKHCCHCQNAIVAPGPVNTSCLPCPSGCCH